MMSTCVRYSLYPIIQIYMREKPGLVHMSFKLVQKNCWFLVFLVCSAFYMLVIYSEGFYVYPKAYEDQTYYVLNPQKIVLVL